MIPKLFNTKSLQFFFKYMPSENNIGPIFQILPTTPVIWQHNKARFTFNIIISLRTYFQNDKANEVLVSVQPFGDIFRKLFQNNYNLVNIISSLLAKPPWFQISNETDSILYTESEKKKQNSQNALFYQETTFCTDMWLPPTTIVHWWSNILRELIQRIKTWSKF